VSGLYPDTLGNPRKERGKGGLTEEEKWPQAWTPKIYDRSPVATTAFWSLHPRWPLPRSSPGSPGLHFGTFWRLETETDNPGLEPSKTTCDHWTTNPQQIEVMQYGLYAAAAWA